MDFIYKISGIRNIQRVLMDAPVYGPVLLVCIYNKYGNILTHDYFYQLFSQYGDIVKILIFEKAKVWKTFIQFTETSSAKNAMINLNYRVVFEDGSKMNIFSSKLKCIKFQNSNLGGVNYEELKTEQIPMFEGELMNRGRRSTLQEYPTTFPQTFSYTYNYSASSLHETNKSLTGDKQSTYSFQDPSESFSARSNNTFDIDEQFLQLARQSQHFRELQKEELNRRKSKTFVSNPNLEQFVQQNSPSRVLFIRSIPEDYSNKCLYNIFSNFGNVLRVIYMKEKSSGLVQFQTLEKAIVAKDELNYAKPAIKIFYSHYQSLLLKQEQEISGDDYEQYKSLSSSKANIDKKKNNPPSQILYITYAHPNSEDELKQICQEIQCPIMDIEWKKNDQDKWMCLADFGKIDKSLKVMGFLQGHKLSKGKQIKFSFTRSKLPKSSPKKYKEVVDNSSM